MCFKYYILLNNFKFIHFRHIFGSTEWKIFFLSGRLINKTTINHENSSFPIYNTSTQLQYAYLPNTNLFADIVGYYVKNTTSKHKFKYN